MTDLVRLLKAHRGVLRRAQLAEAGLSWRAIEAAVASGELVRWSRGVYAAPASTPAAVLVRAFGARLSHVSAARRHGLPLLREPDAVHVTIGPSQHVPLLDGVVLHRARLARGDVWGDVTSVTRTIVDCARMLPITESVAMADTAIRLGVLDYGELACAARGARGPGARKVLAVPQLADHNADSLPESMTRVLLETHGIRRIRSQVHIADVGLVDLLVDGWLVIEVDGYAYHADRRSYREDRRRANALAARGYVLLRLTWEDVVGAPERVVALVRELLARGRPYVR